MAAFLQRPGEGFAPRPGDTVRPFRPTWRDRLSRGAGLLAEKLGAGRDTQQRVSGLASELLDFVPGVGEGLAASDVVRAMEKRDYIGAGLGGAALAAGFVPVIGDEAAKFIRKAEIPAKKLASKAARLYDPPVKAARDFALDYPSGGVADGAGRLQFDIEGRPLGARYIVGRTETAGRDVALPGEALDPIAAALTGEGLRISPQSALGRNAGILSIDRRSGQPTGIRISAALTPAQFPRVARHEVGHAIDELAGQVPTSGLSRELAQIFNSLNTGAERTRNLMGPQHVGYLKAEQPRELMAEALRAYMTDPNYLKTVAPKTAARIREFVNPNPRINKTIQFNSPVAAGLGAGLLGAFALGGTQRGHD